MKKLVTAALLSGLSTLVQADFVGAKVSAESWKQDFSGSAQTAADKADLGDIGIESETNNVFTASVEHPLPIIPNLRLQQTELSTSGDGNFSGDFGGNTYAGAVDSKIDLISTDYTAYLEILDNWVSIDLGLTIRDFDGEMTIDDGTTVGTMDVSGTLPLLYGAAKAELPFSGFYAAAEGNILSFGDVNFLDLRAVVGYETALGLGIELGLRQLDLDYEDDDDKVDLSISGPVLSVFYHF